MKIERKWLWNRLRAMSAREMAHRAYRLSRFLCDSIAWRMGWRMSTSATVQTAPQTLFNTPIVFPVNEGMTVAVKKVAQFRSSWIDNKVHFFDADTEYSLGSPVQWLTDPKTGIRSPHQFGRSIDYRNDQIVGEIKYLWELGRHQFLIPMAVCAVNNNDEDVRMKLESHLSSWLDQNPVGMGIHWCSSLEVSLRLITWSVIHAILQSGGDRNGLLGLNCNVEALKEHIDAQVKFIVGNYSRFSSANNHLTGELTGVWIACNVFDLGAKGRRWRDRAYEELEQEIQRQTHGDGVNKEQAIYYHLWSLEYFWLVWAVAKRYEHSVTEQFENILVDKFIFLKAMCHGTDFPSQIGDADGGTVARFTPDITESAYDSLIQPLSQLLDRGYTANQDCSSVYSKAFWYEKIVSGLDISSIVEIYECREPKEEGASVFKQGGYYIFQRPNCRLLYKAGPFGYLATAAHSHADALSITLAIEGQWWLVDPGTYTYHSDGKWRRYFRSTAAHNTLCVNRQNQSEIAGDFLWAQKANTQVSNMLWCNDQAKLRLANVTGSHDGYAALGITHERSVSCNDQSQFELTDRVSFTGDELHYDLQLSFHFHPEVTLTQLDSHHWLATRQSSTANLLIYVPTEFEWFVARGELEPVSGWYSSAYGEKVPSSTLVGTARLTVDDSSGERLYSSVLKVQNATTSAQSDGDAK